MTHDHDNTGGLAPPSSLRDQVLASLPPDLHAQALANAADAGIIHKDDATWQIVRDIIAANAAAGAAGDAARQVRTAIGTIQTEIYQGAAKAAADIKAHIETSIAGTVNASIAGAAETGADALRKAAADLPAIARQEQGRIMQEWRSALASAARDSAFAGFFQRLSINIGLLIVLIAAIFLGGVFSGAVSIRYIMAAQHRLVPSGWRLDVGKNGKPLCGGLAGRTVCLARRTRPH